MADVSPTVRQRELGLRLRELRQSRGLTVEEVGERLLCAATKISRAETGARRPSLRDVRDLCGLYDVSPEESAELMELARQARQSGWWTQYDGVMPYFPFIGLEQEATAITCFSQYFVPTLLQTGDYARELIRGIVPRIEPGLLAQRVEVQLLRQQILDRPKPPRYRALMDEAVLHRQVGGASIMSAQLEHVLKAVGAGKATVQMIPFGAGSYPVVDSNFCYLEFASLPGLVYVEGTSHQVYLENAADLKAYQEAMEYMRDAALSPRDSVKAIQEFRNG